MKLAHPPSRWADSPSVQEVTAYSLAFVGENDQEFEAARMTGKRCLMNNQ